MCSSRIARCFDDVLDIEGRFWLQLNLCLQQVVEPKKAIVDVDVAKAEEAANAANAIKQECEDALAEALPILVRTSSKLHRKAAICALSIAGQILEYFKHASPRQHCELVIFSGSSTGSFGYHQGRRHQACPEL
jgi:hypothetical protein